MSARADSLQSIPSERLLRVACCNISPDDIDAGREAPIYSFEAFKQSRALALAA